MVITIAGAMESAMMKSLRQRRVEDSYYGAQLSEAKTARRERRKLDN